MIAGKNEALTGDAVQGPLRLGKADEPILSALAFKRKSPEAAFALRHFRKIVSIIAGLFGRSTVVTPPSALCASPTRSSNDPATVAFQARRTSLERANVRLFRSHPDDGEPEFFVEYRGDLRRAPSLTAAKNCAWRMTHRRDAASGVAE